MKIGARWSPADIGLLAAGAGLLVLSGIFVRAGLGGGPPGTRAAATSRSPAAGPALPETGVGPAPIANFVLPGGDFVKAGETTRVNGFGAPQTEPFVLVVPPPAGVPVETFISWNYVLNGAPPATDTIFVNGNSVIGALVGTGVPDLCWGKTGGVSYIASFPGFGPTVPGPNVIAGATDKPLGGDPLAFGEGLSILVVYAAGGPPANVDVYAGYTSTESNGGAPATAVYAFTNVFPGGSAHFFINALDGQQAADDFLINGFLQSGVLAGTFAPGDAWVGLLGPNPIDNLYDHGNDAIGPPVLPAGSGGLVATTPQILDCIGHSFGAIAFPLASSCGNAILEVGEECDPPGSITCPQGSPAMAFLPCNPDCTCPPTPSTTTTTTPTTSTTTTTVCTPTTENCSNGIDDDCDMLIDCADPDCLPARCEAPPRPACTTDADCPPVPGGGQNRCLCPDIRKDPSTIRFGSAGLDVFSSHGRVVPGSSINVMTSEVKWLVTNDATGEIVWEGTLQPGDLTPNAKGTLFRFSDRDAKSGQGIRDGIYKAKIHITRGGTSYGYKLQAYGDMAANTGPRMTIQFYIGNPPHPFVHTELWNQLSWGWKATGFD